MPIPCQPVAFPSHAAAYLEMRSRERRTSEVHEVYLCPEMHWHVQAVDG